MYDIKVNTFRQRFDDGDEDTALFLAELIEYTSLLVESATNGELTVGWYYNKFKNQSDVIIGLPEDFNVSVDIDLI